MASGKSKVRFGIYSKQYDEFDNTSKGLSIFVFPTVFDLIFIMLESIYALALWASSAFIFYELCRIIYRLHFHPLAKFPGSKLAASSYAYEFFQELFAGQGGDYINQVERMHDIYGPIVRVTPDEVHIRDTDWSHVLYTNDGSIRDKDPSLAHAAGTADGSFGTVKHEVHRRRRVPVSSYFSKTTVYEMQNKIWDNANHMCQVLQDHLQNASIVSGRALFLGWSNDTLRSCTFGESLDLLGNPKGAMQFNRVFKAFAAFYPFLKQFEWIIPTALTMPTAPFWYIYTPLAILLKVHVDMIKMAKKATIEHEEKFPAGQKPKAQDNSRTLFHALLSSNLPESEKDPQRMAHEGFEVMLAGSDTTARTMGIAVYHLLANPDIVAKLRRDLQKTMPNPTVSIDLRELERLDYLTAVMKESLRIGKVTDHRLSLIAREEDLTYQGWTIPRGTRISMTPTRNSYDPTYFPEPYEFIPERWLQDDETVKAMEHVFMPFAAGRRGCLGLYFAQAELRIGIASIFRRFEMELFDTVRTRDIDHTWAHIAGEPDKNGKGLRFTVNDVIT